MDDITRQAVAAATDSPLELHEGALAQLTARFERFGSKMTDNNRQQALIPEGAILIENPVGTAPGFIVEGAQAAVIALPGVPREMKQMMAHRVEPELRARFALRPGRLVMLRTLGIGESDLQVALGDWQAEGVVVGFRTQLPENHLKLRFSPDVPEDTVMDHVRTLLGENMRAVAALAIGATTPTLPSRSATIRSEIPTAEAVPPASAHALSLIHISEPTRPY